MEKTEKLVNTIIKGVQEKKGEEIVVINLIEIEGAIAKYFVICQGNSPTQVEAIASSIGDIVRKSLHEKPIHVAGLGNNQWVAIDFSDVLVHIFLPETRTYYNLEMLWEDAKLTKIPNLD
ncbi:MAG: ribosome silencing factor [Segatella oulorum]|jgi:iojap-like protein